MDLFQPMDDYLQEMQRLEVMSRETQLNNARLGEELAQTRAQYEGEVAQVSQDRDILAAQNEEMKRALGKSQDLNDQLANELQAAQEGFRMNLTQLIDERNGLGEENAALKIELSNANDQIQAGLIDNDALKTEMASQADRFDRTHADLRMKFNEAQETWAREKTFMQEQFDRDIDLVRHQNKEILSENEILANKLQTLAREADSIQRELRDEIQRMARHCEIAQARQMEAEEMVEKLAAELVEVKAEYEAKVSELNSLVMFLKEELATLKKTYLQQIQNLELDLVEQNAMHDRLGLELEKQRDLYEKQVSSMLKQRDDFKAISVQLKEDLKIKQDEVIALANHMEAEVARLTQEKQNYWIKLQDKTATNRDANDRLQKMKDRFKAQQAALTASFEARIVALQEAKDSEFAAMLTEINPLKSTIDSLIGDKERLIHESAEIRSKSSTYQEEIALLREHVSFVGKMWNQLTEQLIVDKAQTESEFIEMKKVLSVARDTISTHELENVKNLDLLKKFTSQYLI